MREFESPPSTSLSVFARKAVLFLLLGPKFRMCFINLAELVRLGLLVFSFYSFAPVLAVCSKYLKNLLATSLEQQKRSQEWSMGEDCRKYM
jgi:uncharacterized protein involved in cysteine biosynthesis